VSQRNHMLSGAIAHRRTDWA